MHGHCCVLCHVAGPGAARFVTDALHHATHQLTRPRKMTRFTRKPYTYNSYRTAGFGTTGILGGDVVCSMVCTPSASPILFYYVVPCLKIKHVHRNPNWRARALFAGAAIVRRLRGNPSVPVHTDDGGIRSTSLAIVIISAFPGVLATVVPRSCPSACHDAIVFPDSFATPAHAENRSGDAPEIDGRSWQWGRQ